MKSLRKYLNTDAAFTAAQLITVFVLLSQATH